MTKKVAGLSAIFNNRGTVLQLYALQEAVKKLGYDYEVINYMNLRPFGQRLIGRWNLITSCLLNSNELKNRLARRHARKNSHDYREGHEAQVQRYKHFLTHDIQLSKKCYKSFEELKEGCADYDAYICGSDQVWNPTIYFNNPSYFLAFAPVSKRIAYAPSIALSSIPPRYREGMKKLISPIPHVSVREKSSIKILQSLTGRDDIYSVVDPTMLLTNEDWNKCAAPASIQEPYILCYILESDSYIRKRVQMLSERFKMPVVAIAMNYLEIGNSKDIRKVFDAGPKEFLGLIRNAGLICTDSFHGTVFSILFQRPFYSFQRYAKTLSSKTFSRISDMLKSLSLSSRQMNRDTPMPENPFDVDFTESQRLLQQQCDFSWEYLRNAIEDAFKN